MEAKRPDPRSIPAIAGSADGAMTDEEIWNAEVPFGELADAMQKVMKADPMPWPKMLANRTEEQVYIAEKKARTRAKRASRVLGDRRV